MAELKLPTLKELDQRQQEYAQKVVDSYVEEIVKTIWNQRSSFSGARTLPGAENTLFTADNMVDRITGRLRELYPQGTWYFRSGKDQFGTYYVEWQDHPYPAPKRGFWAYFYERFSL